MAVGCVGDNREGGTLQQNDPSQNSPQLLPGWKILVESLNLSEPQFPPLENQDQNLYLTAVRIRNHICNVPSASPGTQHLFHMCAL